jgi:sulfatase modifying factor 1
MNIIEAISKNKKIGLFSLGTIVLILMTWFAIIKYQQQQRLYVLINTTLEHLVFVEGGTFLMGDQVYINERGKKAFIASSRDASPAHDVTLTSYSMQAYEATFSDFDFYMNYMGENILMPEWRSFKHSGPTYPAKWMTWYQARNYCQWLGEHIGYPIDLATEAQWEFAARSRGKLVAYATNDGTYKRGINVREPADDQFSTPVGTWPPNPLGLYDMTGNVGEWTVDNWHAYQREALVNPRFDEYVPDRSKVSRGFGTLGVSGGKKLYKRKLVAPENAGADNGIRCVVNHPEPITKINSAKR